MSNLDQVHIKHIVKNACVFLKNLCFDVEAFLIETCSRTVPQTKTSSPKTYTDLCCLWSLWCQKNVKFTYFGQTFVKLDQKRRKRCQKVNKVVSWRAWGAWGRGLGDPEEPSRRFFGGPGAVLDTFCLHFGSQNDAKIDQKCVLHTEQVFGRLFASILNQFWLLFGVYFEWFLVKSPRTCGF